MSKHRAPAVRFPRFVASVFVAVLPAVPACKTPAPADSALRADGVAAIGNVLSLGRIASEGEFAALGKDADGLVKGGRIVKFFVDNRSPAAPKTYFLNANYREGGTTPDYAKYHYYFARHKLQVPEPVTEFNDRTYFSLDKRYMAGSIQTYKLDDGAVIYGLQFYPQDVIHGAAALAATQLVAKSLAIPGMRLAFVEAGMQQSTDDVAAEFAAAGITRLSIEKILGAVKYIPMHRGEAWGYLRVFPASQADLTPADIPVFDDLPLDLTVVAGTLTRAYQDSNSHINLKSKERDTPNAVLRDAGPDHPMLAPWRDRPVHMVIGPDALRFEPTTPEVIAAKIAARVNKPWLAIAWEPTGTLLPYDAMCPASPSDCLRQGRRYGSKAANLGFLAHRYVLGRKNVPGTASAKLGYDLVPFGFGIPLRYYFDFVDYPANAALKAKLAELIALEKAGTLSGAARGQLVAAVQALFYAAELPPQNLAAIKAMVAQTLPGIEKVKIRSSANAEDIANFDGAGLHDSYSAKTGVGDTPDHRCTRDVEADEGGGEGDAKMSPRSLACAIKGVYASLWNKRAVEERSFARIDHATVAMGISVLPAYDYQSPIAANSVLVTRVINTEDVYGYSLSVQKKNNLVTNPDPGTWSEVSVAALGVGDETTTLTVTRFAKPKKDKPALTGPVLSRDGTLAMVGLASRVERAYCKAKPDYYNGDCGFVHVDVAKPKALDLEMKVLENGHFVVKQCREFNGH
jgi:hypothetical protein